MPKSNPILLCILSLFFSLNSAFAEDLSEKVIVLANAKSPESIEIADHYIKQRKIPKNNLIAFAMPDTETITWENFVQSIQAPLLQILLERKLIDGELAPVKDKFGRSLLVLPKDFNPEKAKVGENIRYLVICKGVPLRIANEKKFMPPLPAAKEGEPQPKHSPFDVNNAAVDSELALIALPNTPIAGFIPNPHFKDAQEQIVLLKNLALKVARLDGPSVESAKSLVDNALKAEKQGLIGRAYIDRGGPHKQGDDWLKEAAGTIQKLGFDTTIENTRSLIQATTRYDAPALYFGWYTANVAGFFKDPRFRFPPGACAIHIHSFSATSLKNPNLWTAGLIARGATATVGNVYEPYLGPSHHPHYFMEALAAGMTAGDAAAYALPSLSWQSIFVGDPLYRPFKKALKDQLDNSIEYPNKLYQYAYLRAINLAIAQGDEKRVKELERSGKMFAPGLAFALFIAQKHCQASGTNAKWNFVASNIASENPGLLLDTAKFLAEHGQATKAIALYSELLSRALVPAEIRLSVLKTAIACAQRHSVATAPISIWQEEIKKLSTPAKK